VEAVNVLIVLSGAGLLTLVGYFLARGSG